MLRKLMCRLGFHRWVTTVTNGDRYLSCRDCGTYGDEPPAPWKYHDTAHGPRR